MEVERLHHYLQIGVSESTMKRRVREFENSIRQKNSLITDDEMDDKVHELLRQLQENDWVAGQCWIQKSTESNQRTDV